MTAAQLIRRVGKPAVFLACLGPLTWLIARAFRDELGANPVEEITNTTGIWTLRLLAVTLAITPARWLTGWHPIVSFRRMIGLFAFFYGSLHFMIYFVLDRSLLFDGLWEDIVKRPYITVGFTAFVLLIPLAVTSTKGWIRRLGARRWSLLHKLVYVSASLGVLHYWWKVKLDVSDPMVYAVIVASLLGARIVRLARRQPGGAANRAATLRI
ncbi:MAG: sulfite oxidase heme-binding subunit YedZ [Acidobacteriota bacterium]